LRYPSLFVLTQQIPASLPLAVKDQNVHFCLPKPLYVWHFAQQSAGLVALTLLRCWFLYV
jgi:hypothetical protein